MATLLPRWGKQSNCKDGEVVHENSRIMEISKSEFGNKSVVMEADGDKNGGSWR